MEKIPSKELLEIIKTKGWTIRDVSQFFGISRQRLHTVLNENFPSQLWACAIKGLPTCNEKIRKNLQEERKGKVKKKESVKVTHSEFEVDDIVIASKYIGIADEGDRGVIKNLRKNLDGTHEILICICKNKEEDWFSETFFFDHFGSTGLKAG